AQHGAHLGGALAQLVAVRPELFAGGLDQRVQFVAVLGDVVDGDRHGWLLVSGLRSVAVRCGSGHCLADRQGRCQRPDGGKIPLGKRCVRPADASAGLDHDPSPPWLAPASARDSRYTPGCTRSISIPCGSWTSPASSDLSVSENQGRDRNGYRACSAPGPNVTLCASSRSIRSSGSAPATFSGRSSMSFSALCSSSIASSRVLACGRLSPHVTDSAGRGVGLDASMSMSSASTPSYASGCRSGTSLLSCWISAAARASSSPSSSNCGGTGCGPLRAGAVAWSAVRGRGACGGSTVAGSPSSSCSRPSVTSSHWPGVMLRRHSAICVCCCCSWKLYQPSAPFRAAMSVGC